MFLLVSVAFPCAGLFHEEGVRAESTGQAVLLEELPGGSRSTFLVRVEGDTSTFGWVIPVFSQLESVEDGDAELFEALDATTAPTAIWEEEESDGPMCGCMGSKGGGDNLRGWDDTGGVVVLGEGFTGTYTWTEVAADSSEPLLAWLAENGWDGTMQAPAIDAYVAEGGVSFLAVALGGGEPGEDLPPLVVTSRDTSLRYPSTMARYGEVQDVRTTFYVVGDEGAVPSWPVVDVQSIQGGWDVSPDQLWEDTLAEVGAEGGVHRTWAGDHEGRWLTRYDLLVDKELHTQDIRFTLDGGRDYASTIIWLSETQVDESSAAWLLLAGLGAALRRRQRNMGTEER